MKKLNLLLIGSIVLSTVNGFAQNANKKDFHASPSPSYEIKTTKTFSNFTALTFDTLDSSTELGDNIGVYYLHNSRSLMIKNINVEKISKLAIFDSRGNHYGSFEANDFDSDQKLDLTSYEFKSGYYIILMVIHDKTISKKIYISA